MGKRFRHLTRHADGTPLLGAAWYAPAALVLVIIRVAVDAFF